MAAENYHLKWDSHLSYLNSSVATLYKNEKFADVVLYSSSSITDNGSGVENGIPTVGISAHKFILSSCSQFFATMFETAPISSPNGVLYVVLPPDLSHRAIQILVQYMYSGEATVANDILSEVLRGGETLKIRGLCRTSVSSASTNNHHHLHHQRTIDSITVSNGGAHYGPNGARPQPLSSISHAQLPSAQHSTTDMYGGVVTKCPPGNTNCNTRFAIEHVQHHPLQQQQQPPSSALQSEQHQQFRGLGASVLPKDSPVIVKSPKMPQLGLLPGGSKHHNNVGSGTVGGGISVNKEVAIDPEEKCCFQLNQLPVASSLCNEMGCSGGCPMSVEAEQPFRRRQHSQTHDETAVALNVRPTVDQHALEREYVERTRPPPDEHSRRDEADMTGHVYERHLQHVSDGNGNGNGNSNERIREYYVSDQYEHSNAATAKIKMQYTEQSGGGRLAAITPPHTHSFLAIKQEPADWTTTTGSAAEMTHTDHRPKTPLQSPKQPLDFKMPLGGAAVKLEVGVHPHSPSHNNDPDERQPLPSTGAHDGSDYDARLACETCKQSFDEPKSWVQHLETHAGGTNATEPSATLDMVCAAASSSNGNGSSSAGGSATGNESVSNSISNGADALIKTYVPKKRRRVSQQENGAGHVTLCCDLCSISFETPAEWVRHLNNEHTEIELAMFNSKKDSEQKSKPYRDSPTLTDSNRGATSTSSSHNHNHHQHQHQPKRVYASRPTYEHATATASSGGAEPSSSCAVLSERCDICGKKFPTHNNLLAHKRSHNSLNGVSVSVSTSVATATLPTSADISVISSTPNASSNEQLSASPQA